MAAAFASKLLIDRRSGTPELRQTLMNWYDEHGTAVSDCMEPGWPRTALSEPGRSALAATLLACLDALKAKNVPVLQLSKAFGARRISKLAALLGLDLSPEESKLIDYEKAKVVYEVSCATHGVAKLRIAHIYCASAFLV
jgi:hypothetical protein